MAVSATTGVMNPLLGKLTKLLGEEYKKLTGVRKQVTFLKDELSAMKALLDKMELMDKLDPLAKNWRDHIRDMSYDMENCIDDFMHDIEGVHAKAGFVRKMAQRLRRLGRRHQIASRIEQLKVLAVEANDRRGRYKIDDSINLNPSIAVVDPRLTAIYKEAAGLVGIDGPREELVSWLTDPQKKLKVVSIMGFGGLGKTTLAKQVYDKIGGQFNCKAFISVSQRPDVKSLLGGLESKLAIEKYSHACELQEIIDRLREYLKHKRYFIVVDDLWDQPTWNIISCAFPENNNGSRVIVTTRLDEVAVMACQGDRACIYRMKHLEEQDSRRLFFSRVYGHGNKCPTEFNEISIEILKKCGGLPLAIITIASLLASQNSRSLNQWESIKNYLGSNLATKPTLEEMRGILNLSYTHLPIHLRPCLLYLGMYPEDREIMRDDLVRQWIAEGFVCKLHGVGLDEVAKSYFDELINRSLIQPEVSSIGEVNSCRIHDMMLDLILSKSKEANFIRVAYTNEDMARMHSYEYKVRRVSLQSSASGASSETLATSMSQVRSYAQFRKSKYTPPVSQFKYLRVLLFEFHWEWKRTIDLTAIGHLFLLRYLKVLSESASVALPTEIKELVHLETLELVCRSSQSFPSDIACLVNLAHLVLPYDTALPKGIENMKSVLTLHFSGISESSLDDIESLSKLTHLKELIYDKRYNRETTAEKFYALVSSAGMIQDLKHLSLDCKSKFGVHDSLLDSLPNIPSCLELLYLPFWEFSTIPKWIGELHFLRFLSLRVLNLSHDNVHVVGQLPSLVGVRFYVSGFTQDKIVVGAGSFPVLENIVFFADEYDITAYLTFEVGAMPKLQILSLLFLWKDWRGATPVGMESLPCLQEIDVVVVHNSTDTESVKSEEAARADVESAYKDAARVHLKHPSVSVSLS